MNQMKRWIVPAILLLSLGGNIYFVLSRVQSRMGGGCSEVSPDGAHYAEAELLREINPLSPEKGKMWGELSIDINRVEVIRLIVTPPGTTNDQAYRQTEELIRWSQDSKTATFRLPNATIAVTPNKDEAK